MVGDIFVFIGGHLLQRSIRLSVIGPIPTHLQYIRYILINNQNTAMEIIRVFSLFAIV